MINFSFTNLETLDMNLDKTDRDVYDDSSQRSTSLTPSLSHLLHSDIDYLPPRLDGCSRCLVHPPRITISSESPVQTV